MIMLIALSAIMIGGVTASMTNAAALSALRINQVRAYYVAQGAIMRSYADFDKSWGREDVEVSALALAQNPPVVAANYAPLTTNTGNEFINTNFQSNFAYFMTSHPRFLAEWWPQANPSTPATPAFPPAPNLWCATDQLSAQSRLHGWTVKNIRTNIPANTTDDIVVTGARVFWTGGAGLTVSRIRLALRTASFTAQGTTAAFSGAGANGALLTLAGTAGLRTLSPEQYWTGPCTFIQWSGRMPDPSRVSIQFTFSDGSTSHEVQLWDGLINGEGRLHMRTLSITAVGEVRMTKFGARKRLRATFKHGPPAGDHQARSLSWENLDP